MYKKLFAVIGLGALVLAACAAPAPTPAPPTAAPTTAPAATATRVPPTATPLVAIKMKVAYSSANPDPMAAWIAQEAGIFKKNGIEAELSFISGGGNVARALVSGDLQIGVLAPSNIVEATAGGADLVAIAGLVNVMNYDFIVQKGITKAEDLRGKVGAVSSATGSAATALRYTLREFYKLDADKDIAGLRVI
ncbi:MAG: ABC transporter substrate-binding protein, partial [Deltaproteobacteria bacterium]|nr:ABC transporter substrate-binding protein [Deltaproteobacteria bacterium]